MTRVATQDLRYPIGPFAAPVPVTRAHVSAWTADIEQLQREFVHPDTGAASTLAVTAGAYAWHGRHHLAQIERLVAREGWHPEGTP